VAFPLREESDCKEDEIRKRVTEALEIVKLGAHADKFPSDISGGMRKRVALARAVVDVPACIIYDEPHAGLDPMTADTIDRLIKTLQSNHGITNIVITHEIRSVFRIADRVVFMKLGQVYWVGTPEELQATEDPFLRDFIEGNAQDD
jgi:phospholipid/cholesterol/gamma-HCH transport system ATP-binding protein